MSNRNRRRRIQQQHQKQNALKKILESIRNTQRSSTRSPISQIFVRLLPVIGLLIYAVWLFWIKNDSSMLMASPQSDINYREESNYPVRFTMHLKLLPPDSTDDNHLKIQLQQLDYETWSESVWKNLPPDNLDFCISAIWIDQAARDTELNIPINVIDHNYLGANNVLCGNSPTKGTIDFSQNHLLENATFTAINSPNFFVYPFDEFAFEYYVYVYYHVIDKTASDESNIVAALSDEPVEFIFTNGSKNWEYTAERAFFPYVYEGFSYNNFDYMHVKFYRSLTNKVLPSALFAFIVIVTFVISFIKDRSIFWGAIVAVAIGVIGFRQFMLPDFIKTTTAWDLLAVGLLGYLVICIIFYRKR